VIRLSKNKDALIFKVIKMGVKESHEGCALYN
jgi:hypothetical protein